MKFYDIENETIKAVDYEIQIKSMGIVGKATPKNKYNVHVPDNDVQIQRNIDISINRMIANDEAVSDLMVTSCSFCLLNLDNAFEQVNNKKDKDRKVKDLSEILLISLKDGN